MALHQLVGIYGVQAGRVEAGQPHVAHDHDAERGFGVLDLEPVRQLAALVLAATKGAKRNDRDGERRALGEARPAG